MLKTLLKLSGVVLLCIAICTLIIIGDCYLMSLPRFGEAWQFLACIATLIIGLPTLITGFEMAAVLITRVGIYRKIQKSDDLLLRAGLDPTDFYADSSVRPPNFPHAGE